MPKNILVFSDGTGQVGGIRFDEDRTNIYKLFRATRCGPDSSIDPKLQVAIYDPGLGSPADGGFMFGKSGRWIYNLVSRATGLGLTANIVDGYAALIRNYQKGDKIFLFGFSRGAYTVRCLAAVVARCGIPQRMPNGNPVPLDVKGSRKLANSAVRNVYQFCSSRPRVDGAKYRNFMLDTRDLISARFREEHGSGDGTDKMKANVYPYFIGVFDTVAAIANPVAVFWLTVAFFVLIFGAGLLLSILVAFSDVPYLGQIFKYFTFEHNTVKLSAAIGLLGTASLLRTYFKFDFNVPDYGFLKSLATIHFAHPKWKFTDYSLNSNVEYAKHVISIDENRKDFKRVKWRPDLQKVNKRDSHGNLYFEQVWFSGVHADVGGGYPENESRLSDITLGWMLAAASIVPDGIQSDQSVLKLHPDPTGMQHDERKAGNWQVGIRDLPVEKGTTSSVATMHPSVYARFKADNVLLYDRLDKYRPENLSIHADFAHYYNAAVKSAPTVLAGIADNIEVKWLKGQSGRRGGATHSTKLASGR